MVRNTLDGDFETSQVCMQCLWILLSSPGQDSIYAVRLAYMHHCLPACLPGLHALQEFFDFLFTFFPLIVIPTSRSP